MGMGEPLYNLDNVDDAIDIVSDGEGIALSRRRITLSTSGVVPMIARAGEEIGVMLAISLHAMRDDLRDVLVPLNKKYPLAELLAACRAYPGLSNARRITFEYVMLKGVNDTLADARELVRLLDGIPAKINLIPFNPWPGSGYECSDWEDDRALRRHRQPRRLRLADPHPARPRHPRRLRPAEERERTIAHPRAHGVGGDDRRLAFRLPGHGQHTKGALHHGHEARAGGDSGRRRRSRQGVLCREGRLQRRSRPHGQRRAPLRPADAAGVRLLDSPGEGGHRGCPGSVDGLQLVVSDIVAARAELAGRGVDVSAIQDFPWGRFVFFADPDGNKWAVQELPGRRTTP